MNLIWAVEHGVGGQVLLVPITLVERLVPAQLPFRWLTLPAMLVILKANQNKGRGKKKSIFFRKKS